MRPISKEFAISEMRDNGDMIRKWSRQAHNSFLKSLAEEVIMAAGKG